MKCVYCGRETKGTREHIISSGILDLFPECYITFDDARGKAYASDPVVNDVCADCNNNKISYIDTYAKQFIAKYFVTNYEENDTVEIEYDYCMIQKVLLKYAFNDMRAHKDDCSFFNDEMKHFLINSSEKIPKENITVLCGLAVNVSPVPDAFFGNLKLRWVKDPIFFSNSIISNINYETGQVTLNKDVECEHFEDLCFSYAFRFNSVQFLLLCWEKDSPNIEKNNIILNYQYPYYLLNVTNESAVIPLCTDENNYFRFDHVHVKWDPIFEVGQMRKLASGGRYQFKELYEKEWREEEKRIEKEHLRKK